MNRNQKIILALFLFFCTASGICASEHTQKPQNDFEIRFGVKSGEIKIEDSETGYYGLFQMPDKLDHVGIVLSLPVFKDKKSKQWLRYKFEFEQFNLHEQYIGGKNYDLGTSISGYSLFAGVVGELYAFPNELGQFFTNFGVGFGLGHIQGDAYLTTIKNSGEQDLESDSCKNSQTVEEIKNTCEYVEFNENTISYPLPWFGVDNMGLIVDLGFRSKYIGIGASIASHGAKQNNFIFRYYHINYYLSANISF
jgi:hypothetical protein